MKFILVTNPIKVKAYGFEVNCQLSIIHYQLFFRRSKLVGLTYEDAGVNIEAGEEAVDKIKENVEATFTPEVLTELGSFGALFAPDLAGYEEPVLVSGTDGVGTKLKVAFRMNKHDTIGIDLVAMCLNDILAQGARPLFFLDYLATGELRPEQAEEIVTGIAAGCKQAGASLIGGEMAEMPDFYAQGEYDVAGFGVGLVDKQDVVTGEKIKPGDKIIGLASNGIHSNGYSLARKVFFEVANYQVTDKITALGTTLGQELLKPTEIYVGPVLNLLSEYKLKGIAHITGGGLKENIPRILPSGTKAVLKRESWPLPDIFSLIKQLGGIETQEMYKTFNMGIGMALVVEDKVAKEVKQKAQELGVEAYIIGEVKEGNQEVKLN
jgi:phosphoribosylformylglycinamidine cyclo-ligase